MILTTEGKLELTKENVLDQVSELTLWEYYTKTEVVHGRAIKNDRSAVFYVRKDGTILLKDFAKKTYNIWSYLMYKSSKSFYQVLRQVATDFKLDFVNKKGRPSMDIYSTKNDQKVKIPTTTSTAIRICKKPYSDIAKEYWLRYGITIDQLIEDSVYELDHYWIIKEDNAYKFNWLPTNPIYCIDFSKQISTPNKFKLYMPLASKKYRFIQNVDANTIIGEDDLPIGGDYLIITKSYKDRRVLKNLGYSAIAFQGEDSFPEDRKIVQYKRRFDNIIIFFDNDPAGINGANKLHHYYGFRSVKVPDNNLAAKDPSDFYDKYGKENTELICRKLILGI